MPTFSALAEVFLVDLDALAEASEDDFLGDAAIFGKEVSMMNVSPVNGVPLPVHACYYHISA